MNVWLSGYSPIATDTVSVQFAAPGSEQIRFQLKQLIIVTIQNQFKASQTAFEYYNN